MLLKCPYTIQDEELLLGVMIIQDEREFRERSCLLGEGHRRVHRIRHNAEIRECGSRPLAFGMWRSVLLLWPVSSHAQYRPIL
jgi:hypothetical protein